MPWHPTGSAGVFVANASAFVPPPLATRLRASTALPASQASSRTTLGWDWGYGPAVLNQLFVGGARQTLARYPNADPEDPVAGRCLRNAAGEVPAGGCASRISPQHGGNKSQPGGTPLTAKLNNYPTCEMAHCANRGLSPTWGCPECWTCGTFGPYWVNHPPSGHPVYDGDTPVVPGWRNGSLTAFWSDVFARPGGVVSPEIGARSSHWGLGRSLAGAVVHMLHGALWGSWGFSIASVDPAASALTFGYGGYQEARGWSVTAESFFFVEGVKHELDAPHEWWFDPESFEIFYHPAHGVDAAGLARMEFSLPGLNALVSVAASDPAPRAPRVKNVRFDGIEFSETRATLMSERFEVPSAGDWSVWRGAAVEIENA